MRPIHLSLAAAVSTARSIARRGRNCSPNAARSAAATPGSAKITRGYALPARHVIHAVGPVWQGGGANEDALLASCYSVALDLAAANGLFSIAFPAISTGIYAFPADRAARIAVGTVASELSAAPRTLAHVVFCCFSAASAKHHLDVVGDLGLA
jgi:O-acetyl-ADP-ribose deacetylase (regulator of RNase III)